MLGFLHVSDSEGELDAKNNYWGTIVPKEIETKIYDANANIALEDRIRYQPFLTEPHPDTP